jgi:tRNA A-37 threonylcarbamoyl transferase component Bud32
MEVFDYASGEKYEKEGFIKPRDGTGYPKGFKVIESMGKGANNFVRLAELKGIKYVIREPRRRSDTQRHENAVCEFRNTICASRIGIAPALYDAWFCRHSSKRQKNGLYLICEHFDRDLSHMVSSSPGTLLLHRQQVAERALRNISAMSEAGLFNYDLKPSNAVVRKDEKGGFDLRFIDFGKDFCELNPFPPSGELDFLQSCPVTSQLQRFLLTNCDSIREAGEAYASVLFKAMLIIFSATLSCCIESLDCVSLEQKSSLHIVGPACQRARCNSTKVEMDAIKMVLRNEDVRGTLRHYLGRSNSGTRRIFRYANFVTSVHSNVICDSGTEDSTENPSPE